MRYSSLRSLHVFVVCATALGLTSAAQAQSTTPAQPTSEQVEKARAMFASADTDKSGMLSLAEWKAAGRRERGFTMIDTNHDGQVTPDELRAAMAKYRH